MEKLHGAGGDPIRERGWRVGRAARGQSGGRHDDEQNPSSVDRSAPGPYTPAPMSRTSAVSGPATPRARAPHIASRGLRRRVPFAALVACLLMAPAAAPGIAAQEIGSGDGVRFGITAGGISTIGFAVEFFHDHHSLDLTVGTWSFRDLSVALVAKEYFGAGSMHPFVGAGLWVVAAAPRGERLGLAAVLHAPVGVDWRAAGRHSLGLAMHVNRALGVRRTDPEDDLPLNRRLVPLPGVYYRWTR